MSSVKIMCFNIHGGRSLDGRRDLGRVRALMDEMEIDVGVFQEMETRPSRGGTAADVDSLAGPERTHHLPGPSLKDGEGWYGNLIVSRYPILRALAHNLETVVYLEPRNAVDALIDTPAGKLRVIGTHLSLAGFERWSEGQNLIRLIEAVEEEEEGKKVKNPIFLMGDVNEWRSRARLIRHLNSLMKAVPCAATFPSFQPVFRLDRVWHDSEGFEVSATVVNDKAVQFLSDHLPVVVEVRRVTGTAEHAQSFVP